VVTTAGTQSIVDASVIPGIKKWKINQWRDYQIRCDFGTGRTQLRPILSNTDTAITWSDPNQLPINPWANPLTNISIAVSSQYVIESHVATVNTNWTINPDNTSKFVILSGGIWNITQGTTTTPFFSLSYYDVLADQWYGKSTQSGLKTAVFLAASDLSMERFTEAGGVILTGTATAGGARHIHPATTLTPMQYANFQIRIVGGLGIGQSRSILSNTADIINVTRDWDTAPDNTSVYEIWRNCDMLMLVGGGDSAMFQYNIDTDQWTTGKQLDFGSVNILAATRSGQKPYAITSITRTVTGLKSITGVAAGGTGYNVDDILTIDAKGGTCRVLTINPVNGAVLTVGLEQCGTGYVAGTLATVAAPVAGSGCTLTIAAGDIDFTELAVTPVVHDFVVGDSITISGATGTGAAKFNGTYTILGMGTNGLSFSYCSVGDPGAATATIPFTVSTTVLVDCTKNWAVDEHKGKVIQICPSVLLATTAQQRTILSNTATTITWTLATTASTPLNGTWRYVIEDIKPFGTEISNFGRHANMGTEGWATGGSTTTLIDSTKTWQENIWSRVAQRYVRIVEGTGVGSQMLITSNSATTLTYATQTFTPDATTRYVILDTFGTATAGSTTVLTDAQKNWDTNCWVGKRLKFVSGTGAGQELPIASNTATTITYAAATAPDTSTGYAILESSPRSFGLHLDCIIGSTDTTINHKYLYAFTGSATVELSRYNITTEHWELMSYFPQFETMTTGAMYVYDGQDRIYIHLSTTLGMSGRLMYYDLTKNIVVPASTIPYGHSTLVSGNRMEIIETEDHLKYLYIMRHSAQEMWRILLFF
jgi:hypothetical protein